MLKVNVGLSRKLSRDFNSSGFSVNLEGEVPATFDDPEAVVERIKEFYDLAEEVLDQQIERHNGDSAIARRDEPAAPSPAAGQPNSSDSTVQQPPVNGTTGTGAGPQRTADEAATNKQVSYLLTIGKRQRLTTRQLEGEIQNVLGRQVGLYELTKREAGQVIDALTKGTDRGTGAGRNQQGQNAA